MTAPQVLVAAGEAAEARVAELASASAWAPEREQVWARLASSVSCWNRNQRVSGPAALHFLHAKAPYARSLLQNDRESIVAGGARVNLNCRWSNVRRT